MDEKPNSAGTSLININLPDFANTAAKNLTDKPTQSIGQTFTDLWQIVFGNHLSYVAERQKTRYAHKLEEYRKSLERKVAAIPEDKQTTPSLQIAGQALEDSKYCAETEDLREMFSSLIANSMNVDYANRIHPSFSKIIQQLSPLDAQMIKIFNAEQDRGGLAIVDFIKLVNDDEFERLFELVPAKIPANCSQLTAIRSIVSLQRLGLISVTADEKFSDQSRYDAFLSTPLYFELKKQATIRGFKLEMIKHVASLTSLGEDFVTVCLG